MTPEWHPIIDRLLTREGGGREHPSDVGGATRYGMTLATYRSIMNRDASEEELRGLSREVVGNLYYRHWVLHRRLQLHILSPLAVGELVLDTAVLFGRARAAKMLQTAIGGIEVDGWIGQQTRTALTGTSYHRVMREIVEQRVMRHAERVRERPDQAVFLVGWLRRAFEVGGVVA